MKVKELMDMLKNEDLDDIIMVWDNEEGKYSEAETKSENGFVDSIRVLKKIRTQNLQRK